MMARKLLFISYHFPPDAASGVFRTVRFLKYLPEYQWEPLVLTVAWRFYDSATPLNFDLLSNELLSIKVSRTMVIPGTDQLIRQIRKVFRKRSPGIAEPRRGSNENSERSHGDGFLQFFKDVITLAGMIPDKHNNWLPHALFRGLSIIREENPAAIYASGPPFSSFLIGLFLKQITYLPLVLDFRDPWLENPYNEYRFSFEKNANGWFEKRCIAAADRVICNTDALRLALIHKYPFRTPETFLTITNGFDEGEFAGIQPTSTKQDPDAPFTISHIGNMYSSRSPQRFIEALSLLIHQGAIDRDRLIVQFVGQMDIPGFEEWLSRLPDAPRVVFTGHVHKEEALKLGLQSSGLLLIQPKTQLQIPAKVFEYIRLRVPIFAVCGPGATKDLIEANNFGVIAMDQDLLDIERKFHKFYKMLVSCSPCPIPTRNDEVDKKILRFEARNLTAQLVRVLNDLK